MPGCKQQAMTDAQPWFHSRPLLKRGKTYLENPGIISAAVLHVCKHTHTDTHMYTHARTHSLMHTFASAQQRSHNLRESNVVPQFRLTLPEQLLKYFESFNKAPAFGRSEYTAGLVLPLLSKWTLWLISVSKLENHRAKFLIARVCEGTWSKQCTLLKIC